ncbi:ABC transporter substrate-binding protein [Halomonas daqiaonensis]|uniref:Amino acid ABC transporter substrate-binding protein, PAAT family n=1 Tax=Halomonas daqiaonensis TaxID=650850 RepID=A0A1H7WDW9_9GAMM|nr:ABC transporter substrate-binding protein [Halomonas daqiaonensis]SEM19766.1 amino acid ABC transporter substrate-binding protein, PAAT family [Halomonas daqiaonensis]
MKNLTFAISMTVASTLVSASAMAETLNVGANIGNLPWEFQDDNGDYVGFEIDLVEEVGSRLDFDEVVINNIPFNGLFSAVQSGRIDVAVSSITITDERLESVSFAQPYYDSDQSLATNTAKDVTGLEDLDGKIVGVDTGSTGDIWATENQEEYGFSEIRRYEGLQPAMLDLTSGRLDGYISDIPAVQYYVRDKPQLEVVSRIPTGEQYSMMFAKDAELASRANEVISELKKEGFIAELHEKWFGTAPDAGTSTVEVRDMPTAQ